MGVSKKNEARLPAPRIRPTPSHVSRRPGTLKEKARKTGGDGAKNPPSLNQHTPRAHNNADSSRRASGNASSRLDTKDINPQSVEPRDGFFAAGDAGQGVRHGETEVSSPDRCGHSIWDDGLPHRTKFNSLDDDYRDGGTRCDQGFGSPERSG